MIAKEINHAITINIFMILIELNLIEKPNVVFMNFNVSDNV